MLEFGIVLQILLMLLGLLAARAALTTARTPQGAAAWVVFLISFPLLALPAYAVFGGIARLNQQSRAPAPPRADVQGPPDSVRLSQLAHVAGNQVTRGNKVDLLIDGEATFDAIFKQIEQAEHEVLVQFYIIRSDALGLRLQQHLIDAARRGVKVHVLCDIVGSIFLARRYVHKLREAGVDLRGIPGPHRTLRRLGINFRNHRKAVVVDGGVGFTGGINAGQEYIDGGEFSAWRDTFVRLDGPMVEQLRNLFVGDWYAITGDKLEEPPNRPDTDAGESVGLVTGFGPTDPLERGSLLLCGLIGMAKERLWITTPYLVPHMDLMTVLQLAAMRGVEVRLLVPGEWDHYLPWYASRAYFQDLQRAGIEIWEYQEGFMHQKVMLIDDDIASVGSVNLDIRSVLLNFEQTALVEDPAFAAEVERMLEADFARSSLVEPESSARHIRWLAPVARLFGPLL